MFVAHKMSERFPFTSYICFVSHYIDIALYRLSKLESSIKLDNIELSN